MAFNIDPRQFEFFGWRSVRPFFASLGRRLKDLRVAMGERQHVKQCGDVDVTAR